MLNQTVAVRLSGLTEITKLTERKMLRKVLKFSTYVEWKNVLTQMQSFDFVHTWDFHQLSSQNGEGSPAIFVLFDENERALGCWPVLERPIGGTEYFDLNCVYGYGGPLFIKGIDIEIAINEFWQAMRAEGFVSLFSRMHPLYIEDIPIGHLRGEKLGDVVVVNVKSSAGDVQRYRASHRREIAKAENLGLKIHFDFGCESIKNFYEIYTKKMLDLGASNYYFFDLKYFEKLKEVNDFKVIIIYAKLDQEIIASSLFLITNNVMQYYLSGALNDFKKYFPSKLIIHYAHKLASSMGVEKLVLGGGLGSAADDLFKFKSGFSDDTLPFYVIRKVLNEDIYSELCQDKGFDPAKISFFPAYRG